MYALRAAEGRALVLHEGKVHALHAFRCCLVIVCIYLHGICIAVGKQHIIYIKADALVVLHVECRVVVVAEGAVMDGQLARIFLRSHCQRVDVGIHAHAAVGTCALVAEGDAREGDGLSVHGDVEQVLRLRLRWIGHEDGRLAEVLYLLAVGVGAARTTAHNLQRGDKLLFVTVVHDEREGIVAGVGGREVFSVAHIHLAVCLHVGGGGVA